MKQIRRGVFETNSSSSHSISFTSMKPSLEYCEIEDQVYFGEYGWGVEVLKYSFQKLSYVLTSIQYMADDEDHIWRSDEDQNLTKLDELVEQSKYVRWLHEMVLDHTGNDFDLILESGGWGRFGLGYIDHQSNDLLSELWSKDEKKFKDNMRRLIFDSNCSIIIDNDNH